MTTQEVFYYTIIICSWTFLILSLYLFYRLFSLISKIENSIDQFKRRTAPQNIARSIINIVIKLLKSAFSAKDGYGETKGGERNGE